jgi:hypothetical protein
LPRKSSRVRRAREIVGGLEKRRTDSKEISIARRRENRNTHGSPESLDGDCSRGSSAKTVRVDDEVLANVRILDERQQKTDMRKSSKPSSVVERARSWRQRCPVNFQLQRWSSPLFASLEGKRHDQYHQTGNSSYDVTRNSNIDEM